MGGGGCLWVKGVTLCRGTKLGVLRGDVYGGVGPIYTGRMEPLGLRLMGDMAHC